MTKQTRTTDTRPVRACTLPVAEVVGRSWEEFNAALVPCFRLSTDLANWAVHHLFRLDSPGVKDVPDAVRKCYLYGAASKDFPGWKERTANATSSAQCVFRAVERKYKQTRFDVLFRHDSSLLTYRYPFPFPFHNRDWVPSYDAGGFPVVSVPLPGLGRVSLRLKRRADFGRQLAMFKQLHDGVAKRGEAALYRDRKGNLLLKLVGRFPVRERAEKTNAAFVHTDPNAVLVVEVNGHPVSVTNGDHIRRHVAKHKTMLQRTREDKKRELRMDRRQRANLTKYVDDRCGKQNDRLKTYVYQVAAQVARMCERQGVGLVAFDDRNREFVPEGFPWHALKERLRQLVVGEMGCEWIDGEFSHLKDEGEKEQWLAKARAVLSAARKVSAHKSRPRGKSHPVVSTTRAT
jgi:hypothetical protein